MTSGEGRTDQNDPRYHKVQETDTSELRDVEVSKVRMNRVDKISFGVGVNIVVFICIICSTNKVFENAF